MNDMNGTDNDMYGTRTEFEDYMDETNIFHLANCIVEYLKEKHFNVWGLTKEQYIEIQ